MAVDIDYHKYALSYVVKEIEKEDALDTISISPETLKKISRLFKIGNVNYSQSYFNLLIDIERLYPSKKISYSLCHPESDNVTILYLTLKNKHSHIF